MHIIRRTSVALALAAALLAPAAASGQDAGSIAGTVRDTTGLVLPGVTVEAQGADGAVEVAVTDGSGAYTIAGLPPGTYEVSFTLPGFEADPQVVAVTAGAVSDAIDVEMAVALAERVVVVGTRAQPRSVTESTVPVDVITTEDFAAQGGADLTNQLRTIIPSFNVATQPISDAATIVRPINLRNLAPDHTLILVNGKRRHRAAVITWLGNGIADGSQGPDISVIPSIAIRQAEVLRDGASAQYGSDAIAGVLNFQLKDARSGGSMEFRTGAYQDANPGSDAGAGGEYTFAGLNGQAYNFAANTGLPLGRNGFINLSMEYGEADPTSRSVQRNDAAGIIAAGNTNVRNPAQVWGSPLVEDDLKLFANFGNLFDNGLQWYGHTNYARRKVTGGFYFRNPHTRGSVFSTDGGQTLLVGNRALAEHNRITGSNAGFTGAGCPSIPIVDNVPDAGALAAVEADPNCFTLYSRFPGGFTPQFGGNLEDYSFVTGLRGLTDTGFTWDASINLGSNDVDQFIYNTVNASLGWDTPTSFSPGAYRQDDISANFDVSYAASDMINLAAGAEWRDEKFTIRAGDRPSWEIGPYTQQGFSSGSNGFNGYRADVTAGSWNRSNVAVYGDIEVQSPDGRWTVGSAARIERFDLFGTTMNSKLAGRFAATEAFSLRAAVSSGFRAPTPGQQNAFNVSTIFDYEAGDLINQGTVPSISPAALLRGGGPLQPETSINYSVGSVVDTGPFTLTVDYFRIDVHDRIALTEQFRLTESEVVSLEQGGFVEARNLATFIFFANDFSTRTQGVDVVSTYTPPALGGNDTFSFVYNHTDTEITTPLSNTIDARRKAAIEWGLPENRWNVAYTHRGRVNLLARLSYYGNYWDREDASNALGAAMAPMYPFYGGKPLLDLEAGYPFGDALTLSVGAQNILNTYPDENPLAADAVGNLYGQFSPFGFNGAYYYVRINYGWGGGSL